MGGSMFSEADYEDSMKRSCNVCGSRAHTKCTSTGTKGAARGTPRNKPHDARVTGSTKGGVYGSAKNKKKSIFSAPDPAPKEKKKSVFSSPPPPPKKKWYEAPPPPPKKKWYE